MLFDPITLRGMTARNRVWLSPMCQYSATDGMPNDWHLMHYGARAAGGFGLIVTEATGIVPEGRISPWDTGLWNDEQVAAWRRVVDFVHSQGAVIGPQLEHAGRKASTYRPFRGEPKGSIPVAEGWQTVGPSAVAFEDYLPPSELGVEEIAGIVAAFAAAARRAVDAGFDFVELHGAHGYLIHQFYSPLSNHRTDSYGGSFENRVRFLLEVVEAVRAAIPAEMPLFVRISATDWLEGGWTVADSVRLAPLLAERGVDLVDTSTGGNGITEIPLSQGYQVEFAEAVRKAGIATAAVGLITEPAYAESVLAGGRADAVCLGRVALREPGWPQRAAHELGIAWHDAPYPPQYTRGVWA